MSADAAKIAFAVIKDVLASSGQEEEKKEKIILATVKGDIHDIGKNIVKVLLENYGFDVIDLGKDVPPEAIVEKAVEENVTLVGLSALMTTTVVSMEETIILLSNSVARLFIVRQSINPAFLGSRPINRFSATVRFGQRLTS